MIVVLVAAHSLNKQLYLAYFCSA